MEYKQWCDKEMELRQQLHVIEENKKRFEMTAEFKDQKIKALEEEVARLKLKLQPYERAEAQKRIDDYGNMKCTNQWNCHCRSCTDL